MTFPRLAAGLLALVAAIAVAPVGAADTASDPPPAKESADPLAPARAAIADKRWTAAVEALKKADRPASADWNNLMGYSLRKRNPPDLDGAQRHYDAALRIQPQHRGALEYSGELALMKGDLATAEQRLATLVSACGGPCEERADLERAIAKFKANGNRWTP
ncbi:MAG: tetratricopeptide repeat protein [Rubrivivax sp.]|jgi:Flp pilus assembly protein TadD|nr:tetratricopeptide repeat protein [Rubrivivax sp.]